MIIDYVGFSLFNNVMEMFCKLPCSFIGAQRKLFMKYAVMVVDSKYMSVSELLFTNRMTWCTYIDVIITKDWIIIRH